MEEESIIVSIRKKVHPVDSIALGVLADPDIVRAASVCHSPPNIALGGLDTSCVCLFIIYLLVLFLYLLNKTEGFYVAVKL